MEEANFSLMCINHFFNIFSAISVYLYTDERKGDISTLIKSFETKTKFKNKKVYIHPGKIIFTNLSSIYFSFTKLRISMIIHV